MKKFLFRILYVLQFHHLARWFLRRKAILLMYHGFTDRERHEGIVNHQGKHVAIGNFEKQVEYLRRHYHPISLAALGEGLTKGGKIPERAVVLTMDDGYESTYALAFPVLKRQGVPATLFLTTRFIDEGACLWPDRLEFAIHRAPETSFEISVGGRAIAVAIETNNSESRRTSEIRLRNEIKNVAEGEKLRAVEELEKQVGAKLGEAGEPPPLYRPLKWAQVTEMIQSGLISVGSHTHTHVILTRCTPEKAKQELLISKRIIEEKTGSPCRLFCYPNGRPGDFSEETKRLIQATGYACALTTVEGFVEWGEDPFELDRLGVRNQTDFIEFVMTLAGVKLFFSKVKESLGKLLGDGRERA